MNATGVLWISIWHLSTYTLLNALVCCVFVIAYCSLQFCNLRHVDLARSLQHNTPPSKLHISIARGYKAYIGEIQLVVLAVRIVTGLKVDRPTVNP